MNEIGLYTNIKYRFLMGGVVRWRLHTQ